MSSQDPDEVETVGAAAFELESELDPELVEDVDDVELSGVLDELEESAVFVESPPFGLLSGLLGPSAAPVELDFEEPRLSVL